MQIHPDIAATAAAGLYRERLEAAHQARLARSVAAEASPSMPSNMRRHLRAPFVRRTATLVGLAAIAVAAVGCAAESPSPSERPPGLEVPEVIVIPPPPGGGDFGSGGG